MHNGRCFTKASNGQGPHAVAAHDPAGLPFRRQAWRRREAAPWPWSAES